MGKTALFILAVIVTVGVAYILGVTAAGIFQKYRVEKSREEGTRAVLEQMGTGLGIGVALPDAELEDLDGYPVRLRDVLQARTMISFISPGCKGCEIQMERIRESVRGSQADDRFVLISSSDPAELREIKNEYCRNCRFLHDRDNEYVKKLGVFTYPLSFVVDSTLMIVAVIGGAPEKRQLEEIVGYR